MGADAPLNEVVAEVELPLNDSNHHSFESVIDTNVDVIYNEVDAHMSEHG